MANETGCCPDMPAGKKCDYLDLVYRLTHLAAVDNQQVPVEVALHVRIERCTGPMQLGNLVYSTTLLPGERVRLFTSDRRSRFTFDTESQLSYRQEHESEEQTYMESMSRSMSELHNSDRGGSSSSSSGSSSSSAGTSGFLETLFLGPSVEMSGTYNSRSTHEFFRELSSHAQSSHNASVQATRRASSVSVGEVQSRTHTEGESETHLESSSRTFSNPNRCHAVSYLFYQVNKEMTVRLEIKAVRLRVKDPAGVSSVTHVPIGMDSKLHVIPAGVLANSSKVGKLVAEREEAKVAVRAFALNPGYGTSNFVMPIGGKFEPLSAGVRDKALNAVRDDLVKGQVLDVNGQVGAALQQELEFEFKTSLPTPGIVVKGCLDECNTCEPARKREIELELERLSLQNKLLARQIELLEQSQEYRCCPPAPPC